MFYNKRKPFARSATFAEPSGSTGSPASKKQMVAGPRDDTATGAIGGGECNRNDNSSNNLVPNNVTTAAAATVNLFSAQTDLRGYCLPRQPSEVVVGPPDPARVGGEYVKSESTGLQRWVNRGIDPTVVKHQDQSSKVNNDINNANDSRAKQRTLCSSMLDGHHPDDGAPAPFRSDSHRRSTYGRCTNESQQVPSTQEGIVHLEPPSAISSVQTNGGVDHRTQSWRHSEHDSSRLPPASCPRGSPGQILLAASSTTTSIASALNGIEQSAAPILPAPISTLTPASGPPAFCVPAVAVDVWQSGLPKEEQPESFESPTIPQQPLGQSSPAIMMQQIQHQHEQQKRQKQHYKQHQQPRKPFTEDWNGVPTVEPQVSKGCGYIPTPTAASVPPGNDAGQATIAQQHTLLFSGQDRGAKSGENGTTGTPQQPARTAKPQGNRKPYRCGRCGQRKHQHTCPFKHFMNNIRTVGAQTVPLDPALFDPDERPSWPSPDDDRYTTLTPHAYIAVLDNHEDSTGKYDFSTPQVTRPPSTGLEKSGRKQRNVSSSPRLQSASAPASAHQTRGAEGERIAYSSWYGAQVASAYSAGRWTPPDSEHRWPSNPECGGQRDLFINGAGGAYLAPFSNGVMDHAVPLPHIASSAEKPPTPTARPEDADRCRLQEELQVSAGSAGARTGAATGAGEEPMAPTPAGAAVRVDTRTPKSPIKSNLDQQLANLEKALCDDQDTHGRGGAVEEWPGSGVRQQQPQQYRSGGSCSSSVVGNGGVSTGGGAALVLPWLGNGGNTLVSDHPHQHPAFGMAAGNVVAALQQDDSASKEGNSSDVSY